MWVKSGDEPVISTFPNKLREGSWTRRNVIPLTIEKSGEEISRARIWALGERPDISREGVEERVFVCRWFLNGTLAVTFHSSLSLPLSFNSIGIGPAFVSTTAFSPFDLFSPSFSTYEAEPIVGCPANGNSSSGVKMSILYSGCSDEGLGDAGWRNTVSERLNSFAMSCFWVWVRVVDKWEGRRIRARGLPV